LRSPVPGAFGVLMNDFTGRTWLLPMLTEWLESSTRRYFILTGDLGSGKSMTAAWLAGLGPLPLEATPAEQLLKLRSMIHAAHFCVAQSGSTAIGAFTESVATQLRERVAGFREAAANSLHPSQVDISVHQFVAGNVEPGGQVTGASIGQINVHGASEESHFDSALRTPLKTLYATGYQKPIVLLIDALDEALTRTVTRGEITLVQLLGKLEDLPEQVRVVVTTRDDPRVLKEFFDSVCFDLIEQAPAGSADLREFVYARLADYPESRRSPLAKRILDVAEGNFLYARLVISELVPPFEDAEEKVMLGLPKGLPALYTAFLNRELGADEDRWQGEVKTILGLSAVARGGGLTRTEMSAISGMDAEPSLRRCKQYLEGELPNGPFRTFHRSFAEFVLDEPTNIHYHVDADAMHRRIADYYWNTFRGNWERCDDYGLDHLASHLYELRETERLWALLDRERTEVRYRRSHSSFMGLAEDVGLALQVIEKTEQKEWQIEGKIRHTGKQVRGGLLLASINSAAENLSPMDSVEMVRTGRWPSTRALDHAYRIPDANLRLEMLLALARALPELRDEALVSCVAIVKSIRSSEQRVSAAAKLLPAVSGAQRAELLIAGVDAIRELSDVAMAEQQGYYQRYMVPVATGVRSRCVDEFSQALRELWAPDTALSADLRLRATTENDDQTKRRETLEALALELRERAVEASASGQDTSGRGFRESLRTPARIGDEEPRAKAIASLTACLTSATNPAAGAGHAASGRAVDGAPGDTQRSLPDSIEAIREMGISAYLERAPHSRTPPQFPKELTPELLALLADKRMDLASASSATAMTLWAMKAVARDLDQGQLAIADEIVNRLYEPYGTSIEKQECRFIVAKYRGERERTETATAIWHTLNGFGSGYSRLDSIIYDKIPFLTDLATQLPQPQRQEAFNCLIESVKRAVDRGRGYMTWTLNVRASLAIELLAHAPDQERFELASFALEAVRELKAKSAIQNIAWNVLASHLPGDLLTDAEAVDPEGFLVRSLPSELLSDALAVSRQKMNAQWLFALAPMLPVARWSEALAAAQQIGGPAMRADLMARFPSLRDLSLPELHRAWTDTLNGMAKLSRPAFLRCLSALGPVVLTLGGTEAVGEALDAIRELADWWP
jgi:hypothetical protein